VNPEVVKTTERANNRVANGYANLREIFAFCFALILLALLAVGFALLNPSPKLGASKSQISSHFRVISLLSSMRHQSFHFFFCIKTLVSLEF
jgi:hypothetical protein